MARQCVVSDKDYRMHWQGETPPAKPYVVPRYTGPERRTMTRDRRLAGVGGRRRFDRKA